MKPNEPIGNPLFAPMFIRMTLGSYFILAGLLKLKSINNFAQEVIAFELMPKGLSSAYAYLLPYIEISSGTLLILGMWTTAVSIVTSLLLFSFIVALGVFPKADNIFNKDIILLGASLSLLYSGSGMMSIDRFRKTG